MTGKTTVAAVLAVMGVTLMSAGCKNSEDAIVRDCVSAHMRAWDKETESVEKKGNIWDQQLRGSRENAEASAYRTCMKAKSGVR